MEGFLGFMYYYLEVSSLFLALSVVCFVLAGYHQVFRSFSPGKFSLSGLSVGQVALLLFVSAYAIVAVGFMTLVVVENEMWWLG